MARQDYLISVIENLISLGYISLAFSYKIDS